MLNNIKYSYVLVTLQFTCIGLLVILNLSMFTKIIPNLIFLSAIGLFFYTLLFNKLSNFNIIPDIKDDATLITTGAYRYIRHPMYFAVLIAMFAPLYYSMSYTNIIICTVLTIAVFLKAKKEELLWHGESNEYKNYMQNTKMIIPFVL